MKATGATLLVVDDDAMNRDALSRRLASKGFDVLTADSGPMALDIVGSRQIDVVLLDVMMPGMSGIDTLRSLRASRTLSELPVIMVTAKNESDDVVEALELGANDYITKPIDFPVALARIRTQVTSRRVDPLTGLPNRTMFMERLERAVARSREPGGRPHAVFFLDVDRFKSVNDSLGHFAGDELLITLARRLEACVRSTDVVARVGGDPTVARLGGDEFTILVEGLPGAAEAAGLAERMLGVAAEPFVTQGQQVYMSLSVGVVVSAPRYDNAEAMLRDADSAMYRAKKHGKARYEIFDLSMLAAAEHRLQLEGELRHALERGELQVYYQPIVTIQDGQLCGFEALLRWHHPTRGVVLPGDFIAIAEETGLIVSIGAWVLREACGQLRRWQQEFDAAAELIMNVNLSPRQLLRPELVDKVASTLSETGLAARFLKLEVTEGVLIDNTNQVMQILTALRALGVQLGLDDFGTGYSALSYLRQFPFQTLKIDRSFINGLDDTANAEIVRAILSMAKGLSMDVTAEGIETAEQLATLEALDCGLGQGFFFHRPLAGAQAHRVVMAFADRCAAARG